MAEKERGDIILTTEQIKSLKRILLHTVADHIQCPRCSEGFIPKNQNNQAAWEIYKELFEKPKYDHVWEGAYEQTEKVKKKCKKGNETVITVRKVN